VYALQSLALRFLILCSCHNICGSSCIIGSPGSNQIVHQVLYPPNNNHTVIGKSLSPVLIAQLVSELLEALA
jgi:hypothetical protein